MDAGYLIFREIPVKSTFRVLLSSLMENSKSVLKL